MSMAPINLKYLEPNLSRHGKYRYFVRIKGKRIRIKAPVGSEEFMIEYWQHRKKLEDAPKFVPSSLGKVKPGSFRDISLQYQQSDKYLGLGKSTQIKRRQIIAKMHLEPIVPGSDRLFADMPFNRLGVSNIKVLRDHKRETPFAADERLKILREMFRFAILEKHITHNFAADVLPFKKQSEGHHTLTRDEVAQYFSRHPVESKAGLAMVILMFTGIRVSNLRVLGHRNRQGDNFIIKVVKGSARKLVTLTIPIHPDLNRVLSLHGVKSMLYIETVYGKPFSEKGISARVSKWFDQAGIKHGTGQTVRKGLATIIAEDGASDLALDGLFGWSGGKTSRIYTRKANQKTLATKAVEAIDWGAVLHQPATPETHSATPIKKSK